MKNNVVEYKSMMIDCVDEEDKKEYDRCYKEWQNERIKHNPIEEPELASGWNPCFLPTEYASSIYIIDLHSEFDCKVFVQYIETLYSKETEKFKIKSSKGVKNVECEIKDVEVQYSDNIYTITYEVYEPVFFNGVAWPYRGEGPSYEMTDDFKEVLTLIK